MGGLVISGLVGDIWRVLSSFETVAQVGRPPNQDLSPLDRVRVWAAAGLLLAFAWLELVHPNPADPRTLGRAMAVLDHQSASTTSPSPGPLGPPLGRENEQRQQRPSAP